MKYFKSERTKSGGFLTTEWTADEMFGAGMTEFLIKLTIFALLSIVASITLLFVRLYDFEENEKAPNIWGVIISAYFVADMHYQLVLHFLFTFFSTIDIPFWSRLNFGVMATHILTLIFGNMLFYGIDDDDTSRKYYLGLITIASIIVFYFFGYIIF